MGKKSTRDSRRQSRLVRGTEKGFTISTIDHTENGRERLDATITYQGENMESVVFAHPSDDYDHDAFFRYGYLNSKSEVEVSISLSCWHLI